MSHIQPTVQKLAHVCQNPKPASRSLALSQLSYSAATLFSCLNPSQSPQARATRHDCRPSATAHLQLWNRPRCSRHQRADHLPSLASSPPTYNCRVARLCSPLNLEKLALPQTIQGTMNLAYWVAFRAPNRAVPRVVPDPRSGSTFPSQGTGHRPAFPATMCQTNHYSEMMKSWKDLFLAQKKIFLAERSFLYLS
jgi:hypothetical protein